MAPPEESMKAKEFNPPAQGNAGVYIFRNTSRAIFLKKDIWIDGECIGESAPNVFFYTQVAGGKTYQIETESLFSSNTLDVTLESGKNYFIQQLIVTVDLAIVGLLGVAELEQVSEEEGKELVTWLEMAKPGNCSAPPR
jgi:hypothetical protein